MTNAIRLVPGNADYHSLLAEHLEAAGENPDSELEKATDLSPHESRYWIRRAFRAEVEQKYDDCERYLLEAYRVDNGFDPRWALMNYYFRRGKFPEFWKATREALDISYGSLDPIFRLCLVASEDPSVTRKILPPRRDIILAFFTYLVQRPPIESAAGIAAELAPGAQPEEVPVLLDYCDKQTGHDNKSSLMVWNALCRRRLIHFSELDPESGRIVTNGDFTVAPLQRGFDWKYGTDGVSVGPMDAARGIAVDIGGKQPDTTLVIEQLVPLAPGKLYALNYEYRLVGTQPDSGLQWSIRGAGPDGTDIGEPIATSPVFSATDWTTGQTIFSAGQRDAVRLVLQYRRALGTVRWKGALQIRSVTSRLAAQPDSATPGSAK